MQDRVPRQVCIRIRAGVQQIGRQFEMSVRYRHEQGAGAGPGGAPPVAKALLRRFLCGLVYLYSRLQQDPYNAGPAFSQGEQQRCKPGVQTCAEIRSGLDECVHNLLMTFRRRPHQRRLSAPAFLTVNVGSAG